MIAGFYSPHCAFDNLSYVPVAGRFLAEAAVSLVALCALRPAPPARSGPFVVAQVHNI